MRALLGSTSVWRVSLAVASASTVRLASTRPRVVRRLHLHASTAWLVGTRRRLACPMFRSASLAESGSTHRGMASTMRTSASIVLRVGGRHRSVWMLARSASVVVLVGTQRVRVSRAMVCAWVADLGSTQRRSVWARTGASGALLARGHRLLVLMRHRSASRAWLGSTSAMRANRAMCASSVRVVSGRRVLV